MVATEHTSKVPQWMFAIGVVLILSGLYGFIRIVHVSIRHVPYPSAGVLPQTILTPESYFNLSGRESDCDPYPQIYYEADGQTVRQFSEEEKSLQEELSKRCVNGFDEDRAKQKQRDKNQSAFLVFVGAGLVLSRRFLN